MSLKDTSVSAWETFPVILAEGFSTTDTINLGGLRLFGIVMPVAWTTANLTFQMSPDSGATWVDMFDQNGNEILAVGETEAYIGMNTPPHFAPLQFLRIRSGSSSVPVTQDADRVLKLLLRRV